MNEHIRIAVLVTVVALGAVTGVATAEGDLGVTINGVTGEPTVTVTENDIAVLNATVTVFLADASNGSYAGTGTYTTDANGTVGLPPAAEPVDVVVTTTAQNRTASTTVTLTSPEPEARPPTDSRPFGQLVREFVASLRDREGGVGEAVSTFVSENAPRNATDAPGNATDAPGNATDAPTPEASGDAPPARPGAAGERPGVAADRPADVTDRPGDASRSTEANGATDDGRDTRRGPPDFAEAGGLDEGSDEDDADEDVDDADDNMDVDDADEDEDDADDDVDDADEDADDADDVGRGSTAQRGPAPDAGPR
jgi:hypothetical protein